MYNVQIIVKFLDESANLQDESINFEDETTSSNELAKQVIADLIEEASLTIDKVQFLDDKLQIFRSIKYELTSKELINYYELVKEWCSSRTYNGWLKMYSYSSEESLNYQAQVFTRASELSIGNFSDYKTYRKHIDLKPANSKRIVIDFEHDMQKITCYIITDNEWYKLSFEYTSVEGFVVGDIFYDDFSMYLPIRSPPKVWMASKSDIESQRQKCFKVNAEAKQWPEEKVEENILKYIHWYRHNAVGTCRPEIFGSCSVFQFCIDSSTMENSDIVDNFAHKQVIAGFLKHRYTVYFAPIEFPDGEIPFRRSIVENIISKDVPRQLNTSVTRFTIRYGILMLVSKGTRFTDQFSINGDVHKALGDVIRSLKHEEQLVPLIKAFAMLCNKLDQQRFIDIASTLKKTFEDEKTKFNEKDVIVEETKNLLMVRRIIITPTRILYQPPELNTSNRVLRKYTPDHFVRVSFRDEDFGPLNLSWEYDQKDNSLIKRVSDFFHNGIQIGEKGRCYRFLGCSNSQLRSSGAWFVCEEGGVTVKSIREWIGDFTNERSLSKYVSRLGLAFTTTESLLIDSAHEQMIPDIETADKKYNFSDGIGKISPAIANQIMKDRDLKYLPSAFQIRYGGCKGMVAIDPTLGDSELTIQIRPSMKKFESHLKDIEYCQASQPSQLYMNRQVIWLLRGYGVPSREFINLQNDTLLELAKSLKDPEHASKCLENYQGDDIFSQITNAKIDLTQEPFHRMQLLSLYRFHVKEVLTRTRIVMDANIGRQMIGVMDETGTLEYGQVFVQYSADVSHKGKNKQILKRKIFITKNPCVHPGDLQTFTAVDVPQLHHLCDVVVFPSKGRRPHPNELSGSDLDGDEYFVCWLDNLLPRIPNKKPAAYEAAPTVLQDEPITPTQVIEQVVKHITKPNNLGKISNAHTVHCDMESVDCEKAIRLAEQHSIAVDYPKTGVPEDFTKDLRVYEYPDWMEKPDKPCYRSTSVVGDCYRICRSLDHVLGEEQQESLGDPANLKPDPVFIYQGWDRYLPDAIVRCEEYNRTLSTLMSQYGLLHEGDIACGCLNTVKQAIDKDRKKNYDITEECVRIFRSLKTKNQKAFFAEFGVLKDEWTQECRIECYRKASAWYLAAYKYVKMSDNSKNRLLSFPWCVSEVFCEMAKERKESLAGKQSCTDQLIANMTEWFISQTRQKKSDPSTQYGGTKESLESFAQTFQLEEIGSELYGLPFNNNVLTYYCNAPRSGSPLAKLQQDMFEAHSGWDKSYLHLVGSREVYLALRHSPSIYILRDIECLKKLYTIRQYLEHYPELQVPAGVIIKWVDSNSLDAELHVLNTDFIVLFIMILIMEKKIDAIAISPPTSPSDILTELTSSPVTMVTDKQPATADLYFLFLDSLIYGRAVESLDSYPWIPPEIKEMNMSLCSILNTHRIKFVSYAMREYHETCYFLFSKEQVGSDTARRRGKRNKIVKFKPDLVFPVCYDTDLCARHLHKHSNVEVNMRRTNMHRSEIIVIEVWGNTPEVLQDVTESMQRQPKSEVFKRVSKFSKDIRVVGSHRVYLGEVFEGSDEAVTSIYKNKEGHDLYNTFTVLSFQKWRDLEVSADMFLKQQTQMIREHHNIYAHGVLSATCEIGRFCDFRNSFERAGHKTVYVDSLRSEQSDQETMIEILRALGFEKKGEFSRVRYTYQTDEKVAVTLHMSVSNNNLTLEKVSWADMTWCELHLNSMNKEKQPTDRDFIFNIESCASLTAEELKETKTWKNIGDNLSEIIQWIPLSFQNGMRIAGKAAIPKERAQRAASEKSYERVETEIVKLYAQSGSTFTRLSKIKFEIIERLTETYNKRVADPKRSRFIATLPQFDKQTTGLLSDFFETCLKLH